MSQNEIVNRFCKSGDWHHLSRRFRNLTPDQRRWVVRFIQAGNDAETAIAKAKLTTG